MEKQILEFHDKYTEIMVLQGNLPKNRGNKDYSETEFSIIKKARSLKGEINEYLKTLSENDAFIPQLNNMLDGLNKIINDPYKRLR